MDARTLKKEDLQKETVYCLNDDNETEVPKEDTIQGARLWESCFRAVGGRLGFVLVVLVDVFLSSRDMTTGGTMSSSVGSEAGWFPRCTWVLPLGSTCPPVTRLNTWFYFKVWNILAKSTSINVAEASFFVYFRGDYSSECQFQVLKILLALLPSGSLGDQKHLCPLYGFMFTRLFTVVLHVWYIRSV